MDVSDLVQNKITKSLLDIITSGKPLDRSCLEYLEQYSATKFAEDFYYFLPILWHKNIKNLNVIDARVKGIVKRTWLVQEQFNTKIHSLSTELNKHAIKYCFLGGLPTSRFYPNPKLRTLGTHALFLSNKVRDSLPSLKAFKALNFSPNEGEIYFKELGISVKLEYVSEKSFFLNKSNLVKQNSANKNTYYFTLNAFSTLRHLIQVEEKMSAHLIDLTYLSNYLETASLSKNFYQQQLLSDAQKILQLEVPTTGKIEKIDKLKYKLLAYVFNS